LKYFLAFSLVFIVSASAAAQTAYEQYMSLGMSSLDRKDYNPAEEAFRAALKEKPDDYRATLYLGIVLSRQGLKEGESLLKKALYMNPGDPMTNLQLGLYYLNRSVYPEAMDYFENTIELAPGSEYSSEARKYLKTMGTKESKPWKLDAALGFQYDSNVILGPGNAPLPEGISRKSDWSAVAYLKGQYDIVDTQNFKVTPSYTIYQNLHAKLSDFNVTYQAAGVDALYELSKTITLKGTYTYEYVLVGGNAYDFAHTLTPAVMVNEGAGFFTTVHYSYRKAHFMNASLFPDNSDRTGFNNLIGITQHLPIGDLMEVKAGYTYDNDSARKDFWAYRGNKGFANLTIKLLQSLSMDLYGEYYDQKYEGINPAISGNVRHDKVQTYSLTLTKRLSNRVGVILGQLYVRNKSNINDFDYKRAITSIFLTVRF
jgi:hypothetical protein